MIAKSHKNVLDLLQDLIHGVLVPHCHFRAWDRYIHSLGGKLSFQNGGVDCGFPLLQLFLNGGANRVGQLSHDRPLLSAELAHLLENGGKLTFFTQQLYPQFLQCSGCGRFLQGSHCLGANAFQLLFHVLSSLKNEKTFQSRTGTKGNASAVPPAFSPLKTARFRTQPCPRWITASPVRPYSHTVFRRRLPGESPTLHASGSHHPALAVCAKPTQGSPITAFSYLSNSSTIKRNLQALFRFSLTKRKERDMLFLNF